MRSIIRQKYPPRNHFLQQIYSRTRGQGSGVSSQAAAVKRKTIQMEDDKITRLTAEINRFAISQNWLPKTDYDTVWQIWKELTTNAPPPTETIPNTVMHKLLPIWEQCYTILNGLLQNRNAYPFERPVDPIRDGVPNYFEVVKKPMDLKTVKERLALTVRRRHEPLKADMYRYPDQFKADMDQIWENCFLYNPPGYQVRDMGAALKNDFEQRWKTMKIESQVARILKEVCFSHDHQPTVSSRAYRVSRLKLTIIHLRRYLGSPYLKESLSHTKV